MSRAVRRATSFDDLPDDISFNIFFRVPVKSLIRSSAVSKSWYSLVKNPNFVSAHISHSISSLNEDTVLLIPTAMMHVKHCYLVSAETGFVFDKYEVPFTTAIDNLTLVGSVNGLVCFTYVDYVASYPSLYVWNPSLRKYRCIVSSSFRKRYPSEVLISFAHGFGFHEDSGDYRVVRIMYVNDRRDELTPRVEVFSLRNNKWRPCRTKNTILPRVDSRTGITVNSTVYWLKRGSYTTNSEGVWILWYDFNSEVFGEIKLPDDVCYEKIADFQLMKFEGSLSVCVRYRPTKIKKSLTEIKNKKKLRQRCCIWLISHEDDIVSSTLRFRVVLKKFGEPLNITNGGDLLMKRSFAWRTSATVLSCNLKKMQYRRLKFPKAPYRVETSFIESLAGDELLISAK
ncbi:F-box/kelch-repeat protein At3g23880-like [Apium graveolens]|uniref:F-box/kelch-repeat protein At3g23880-like n=1 Tax=Apium graveolens TaxID=4045 RepID=UPI003D7C120B